MRVVRRWSVIVAAWWLGGSIDASAVPARGADKPKPAVTKESEPVEKETLKKEPVRKAAAEKEAEKPDAGKAEKPASAGVKPATKSTADKKPADKKPAGKPESAKPGDTKSAEATRKPTPPKKNPREYVSGNKWAEPKIIDPGPPGGPPSDAVVLFDGKDLNSEFAGAEEWIVSGGVATVAGKQSIQTKRPFGSCQLHLEWATPDKVTGSGQGRGNSGVYLMNTYEVQILDSFQNTTYYDGQAGAIYKQVPPLVNASRGPGQWQTYDIVFHAPKFADDGKLLAPATVTVFHNGVLVQDHFELQGGTFFDRPPSYAKHPPKAPLQIQNHGNPMRFRNIWIRELNAAPRS